MQVTVRKKAVQSIISLMGEAYYFRAWYYYQMFISYGRLTWVDTPLDPNLEEMKLPRANRTIYCR